MTEKTQPTDDEIAALYAEQTGFILDDSPAALLDFARAVLARWGQPAPQHQARPVTPYTCPKCSALWLHWPAEQSGFGRDTLNCRSTTHCDYCEKGGVEQLQRLERVPAVLAAPQQEAQEPMAWHEQARAIREGNEIAASDKYFSARPQIVSADRRKVFQAGFERGWDAARAAQEGKSNDR